MTTTKVKDFSKEIARFEEMKSYFSVDFETGLITRIKILGNDMKSKIGDVMKGKRSGYIVFKFNGNYITAHRFIFYCYHGVLYPIIDHKNGITDDNRILNLRGGTQGQNCQNITKAQINNKSRFLGVRLHSKTNKYDARLCANGKRIFLGYFDAPELAHEAYVAAKRMYHEFCTI